jgi:hypothetical protein
MPVLVSFLLHLLPELPGDDAFDRGHGRLFADAFLMEEVVQRRSAMRVSSGRAHEVVSIVARGEADHALLLRAWPKTVAQP